MLPSMRSSSAGGGELLQRTRSLYSPPGGGLGKDKSVGTWLFLTGWGKEKNDLR